MKRKRVTLEQVARAAGVSRATVSLVVRKSPLVAEATREKVECVMADMDYVRDLGAARMRSNLSRTVGVIVPNLVNSFFTEFLAGVETVMGEEDRVVLLANSQDDSARQDTILQRFRGHGVDGVILCPAAGTAEDLPRRMREWELPLVQSLREISAGSSDYAGADYIEGTRLAVRHLVDQGHRRIAFLSDKTATSARSERLAGFNAALIETHAENAGTVETELTWCGAMQTARDVLALPAAPTAILCFNDILAAGLMSGLRQNGVEPGVDLAVMGLDDLPLAQLTHPALSSIAMMPDQIGMAAARQLARRLAQPDAEISRTIITPRIVIRSSTGC
ncbi:LacI family DNA-binding transcriptional regulator [Paracoccus sp. Z330]|uniref:LacI family DNA-binding transcriptional regulator n=1 Tax=Paracoccus onchidii TaxID=3017813 RepID=A0ABT4ZAU6_9RHOB|nr:LacI family DNA-binding transcriptional regulator [Paracoccus onchidii]MDB6176267.1 LacI family DNA-binding transcriptional regulator [Paracoccus onchidii]